MIRSFSPAYRSLPCFLVGCTLTTFSLLWTPLSLTSAAPLLPRGDKKKIPVKPRTKAPPRPHSAVPGFVVIVKVVGLRNNKGQVLLSMFNNKRGFPGKPLRALKKALLPIKNKVAVFRTAVPAIGRYAVAVVHDQNANRKLDTNFVGIPKEGYGFSRNVTGWFGPPKFKAAAVRITPRSQITTIQIKMRY